ncbi:hypothetical protein GCM10010517_20020 [Streptosporangium fragile]|uniref:TIGR04222 domain-containing membrane protein n=1 Tax=Streptosporangium fragile TaxID=46186 RepID=A0ABP6ICT3_9ACTN
MDTVQIIVVTVALLVVTGLFALRLARHSTRSYEGPDLTPYDLAMLAGGRSRVLDTALAELVEGKAVRARRSGELTRVGTGPARSPHPVAAGILALLEARPDGVPVWEVRREAAEGPATAELVTRLRELGLIDPPGSGRADPTHPNRIGQTALAHYRLRHREDRSLPPRSRDRVATDALNLFGIALYGLHQMKDDDLCAVLSMGGPPPPPESRRLHRPRKAQGRRAGSSAASGSSTGGCGGSWGDGGSGGGSGGCGGGGGGCGGGG